MRKLKKIFPLSFRGFLFCGLTFVNVGLATFFISNNFHLQGVLCIVTSLLCFGVWYTEIDLDS